MRVKNITRIYGALGKVLCSAAGAIVGFVLGGVPIAFVGLAIGFAAGHLLAKVAVSSELTNASSKR